MTPVEQIKDKLNVVDFLKGYLELKPAGKNFKALCPFHSEKTPSFMVSPDRQLWRCFGCGEGGDIFKFLMRHDNLEFYEALQVLAEKAGVDLRKTSSADQRQLNVLYDTVNTAKEIFQAKLKESKAAGEYLKGRGLTGETALEFELGFSPPGVDIVTVELLNKGFRIEDIIKSGLAVKTERGKYIDRFRGRVIFPIHNHFGKVVGFSGRLLPDDQSEMAKYINSPETPIFNKSRILYGFWQSKKGIKKEGKALLVEGQMDFLQLWQNGITNVIATSGTSLTADHLRALNRVADEMLVAFDRDDAGLKAAERAIDMAGAQDLNVLVLDLGQYSDPAEAAEKDPKFLKTAIKQAVPAMQHYFAYYLNAKALADMTSKKMAIRRVLSKIANLASGVERSHWLRELSFRVGVGEKELTEEMELVGEEEPQVREEDRPTRQKRELDRRDLIAERIVHITTMREDLRDAVGQYKVFMPEIYRQIYEAIVDSKELAGEAKELFEFISLYPDFVGRGVGDLHAEELQTLLQELELEHLRTVKDNLRRQVLVAERQGDGEVLAERLREFDDITRKMQDIKHAKGA